MPEPVKGQELKLLSKPPTLAVDGNFIGLNDKNYGDLTFFQISNQTDKVVEANGVASIRMTLEQFKLLRDSLIKVIDEHQKKTEKK
ncbi:MAG: hypothetical protein M1426_04840 [Patescibacteria group bacterium]|nr:hypothetical protein [Patescibacteria group bacterium]